MAEPVALAALPVWLLEAVTPAGRVGEAEDDVGPVAEAMEEPPEEDAVIDMEPEDEEDEPYAFAASQYCVTWD